MSDELEPTPNKVLSMYEARTKKSQKSKPQLAYLFRELVDDLNGVPSGNPKFEQKFYVVEPEPGKRKVIEEYSPGLVRYVAAERVENCVAVYTATAIGGSGLFAWTMKTVAAFVEYWMAITTPIPSPPLVAEKTQAGVAFHRLSFDFATTNGPCPTYDNFFSRCTNETAIRAWIGSLFFQESSLFQYCWIYGEGGEGKGSLGKALGAVFGPAYVTPQLPDTPGQKQFFAHALLGKRVAVFPECDKFNFPNQALFKQLTGGDFVWYEQKHEPGFTGKSQTKFLFLSNERPSVNGSSANLRRMIYGEVTKPNKAYPPNVYDALMIAEAPYFLTKCWKLYKEKYPNHEVISASDSTTIELIETNEEDLGVVSDKWFIHEPGGFVTSARIQEIKTLEKMDEYRYRKLLEYMRRKWDIKPKQVGARRDRGWLGMRERSVTEQVVWEHEKHPQ